MNRSLHSGGGAAEVPAIEIAGRIWSERSACVLIAEVGVNHNGDVELAGRLVAEAARAGAPVVKFQVFSAAQLASAQAPLADYQRRAGTGQNQRAMLQDLELPGEAYARLRAECERLGVLFLASPFDEESADLLQAVGVPAYKVPSGELTNAPLLAHLARKGKPLIVSTGMATMAEIDMALQVIAGQGEIPVVLLQCTSRYPCPPEDVNLRAMGSLKTVFGTPVGFSDHTQGIEIALAAAALGACAVEKHFTLDRTLPGPDHAASMEPAELVQLAVGLDRVHRALGHAHKRPSAEERAMAAVARKSWVTVQAVAAGAELTEQHLTLRRPGTGLPPEALPHLLGRRSRHALPADTLLDWTMLE